MRVNFLHSQALTRVVVRCILFLLVLVSTLQCTFDPDEEYFKTVAQPELTPTVISFFSMPDTADFRGNIDLYLNSSNQQEIIRHTLTLNDAVLSEERTAPSHITINSRKFPDGIYDLKLKMTKRVTGESLASKLGEERVDVELTKKVIIFNAPIPKPEMSTSIVDGVLMLHWKPYTGPSFVKYVIRGATINNDITITDSRQKSIPLADFVGGRAFFSMQVHAYTEWSEEYKQFDYPLNVSITKTPQGLHLSWGESPFVNYNGAEIEIGIGQQHTRISLDKTQRSFAYDLLWTFPHNVSAAVRAVSKRNVGFWIGGKSFTTQFMLGNFNNGLDIFKTSSDSVYIILKESIGSATYTKSFTHVNTKNGNGIRAKGGYANISPSGLLLYEFRDNTTLMRINPNTLEYAESVDVSSFVTNIYKVHSVFVSNGNIVVLYIGHKYTNRPEENWYYAIDCNTRQLMFAKKVTNNANALHEHGELSDDGRTFYRYDRLIRLDQTPVSTRSFDYGGQYQETALPQRAESMFWGLDHLVEKQLNSPYDAVSIPYPKKVLKIFTSGDNSVIGVAYAENNLVKFDFLEAGTLNILGTLQTTLQQGSWSSFNAKIVDRSLYLYIQYEGTFHKFDF